MAEQEQNRNENATPFKLEQARKRGIVSKSPDMVSAAILIAMVAYLYAMGWSSTRDQLMLARAALAQAGRLDFSFGSTLGLVERLLTDSLCALAPFLLTLVLTAVVANLGQTGPVFSFKPLGPDFDRINPAKGFERLFSMHLVYTAVKSLIKLALLACVFVLAVRYLVGSLIGLLNVDPRNYAPRLLDLSASLAFKLALVILVMALIDVAWVRWEFAKRMRMSRRELREEIKHREGDPRVRVRHRELRNELLKRSRALKKVPSADVLVTNPTHVAVAISYKHGEMHAPQLVAKGAGALAETMKKLARRHCVPVVEQPGLARALFHRVEHDAFVPEEFYPQVLKILVWVYAMREARAEASPA